MTTGCHRNDFNHRPRRSQKYVVSIHKGSQQVRRKCHYCPERRRKQRPGVCTLWFSAPHRDVHRNDGLERPVSFPRSSLFLLSKAIRSCPPTLATGLRFFSSRFHSSSLVSRTTHIHRLRASHHFPLAPPFSGSTFCGF